MRNKIIFLLLLSYFFFSCKIDYEDYIISSVKKNRSIDLELLIGEFYDYLIILDEGSTLQHYDIKCTGESIWIGQKILYIRGDKVVKQINLSYYISEPDKKNYVSFFEDSTPGTKYIKREYRHTVFSLKNIQSVGTNSFCFYLE